MDANDLYYLSALELSELYRKRQLSPVEVTEAILERIDKHNSSLNAFVTVTAELALEQARAAEREFKENQFPPPLTGIPLSIKDLVPTKGIRTTRGSLLYKDWVPDFDPPVVERLNAAGAVLLGKTNTPELGWKGGSGNRVVGPTHNPWKHGLTSGGSSGGAGAAVASGMGPIAQGSDGGGSIRIPASFCGIYGLKPSFGIIPQYPASAIALVSHMGPMTRTVRDAALMLNVMAGVDPRDPNSLPIDIHYPKMVEGGISGLRVAWSPDLGHAQIDPEVGEITAKAAARFSELGCQVEEAHPQLEDPWENIFKVIWASAFTAVHLNDLDEVQDLLDPSLLEVIKLGETYSAAELAAAYSLRYEYYQGWRQFMGKYDLMLTPTLPVTAFKAADDQPQEINGQPTSMVGWTMFTYPFNLTGQPAATVPCGFTGDGLPVGLQIVGRWRDDITVLRASAAFEDLAPWAEKRPTIEEREV